ncbi:Cleavage induced Predicted protein [Phytophthora palmivora]|uniref:Uncharacterized protein n=1 Tax=Phytophthora palmivora TaxID=4796 RepID=A0A2P4X7Q6_9STRA|nr:Cleavage induced Predicted protein [Phytophthora palmivora]
MGFVRSPPPTAGVHPTIDKIACDSLSRIISDNNFAVQQATQFLRGECTSDTRPNKAIAVERLRRVLAGYSHLDLLVKIAESGIEVKWPSRPPPKNHGSFRRYLPAITKALRIGQDSGQYMIINADILVRWKNVICSPLGAVEKKDVDPSDEVRLIHDLSFPKGDAVNDAFKADSVPKLPFKSVIARYIEYLAKAGYTGRIRMLKGDVKKAFLHLRTAACETFRMAAFVPELEVLVIDMSAPFGWAGSPPCYSLFGRAISWLMVVLGPRSINESKFSDWSDELVVLGLLWNTRRLTVSIPDVKIVKARNRVTDMLKRGRASKTDFYKLLGSLRHVANCLRTAKPFYQRLQKQCTSAPRFGKSKLSAGSLADLKWFSHILDHGCLAELPLGMFGALPPPDVELYMDASNYGLAVLDPGCDSFIQVKFDNEELAQIDEVKDSSDGFSINVREHLCIPLSLWTWGAKWNRQSKGNTIHVKCWSDNSSAVTWCNRLHANNRLSQELNRAIGLAEAYFKLRISVDHLPGSSNWMADSASRAWTEPDSSRWANFSSCWLQDLVPMGCRTLYTSFSEHFSPVHWPRPQHNTIPAHGHSGHNAVLGFNFPCGYPKIHKNTLINSRFLLRIAGNLGGDVQCDGVESSNTMSRLRLQLVQGITMSYDRGSMPDSRNIQLVSRWKQRRSWSSATV